ncbi:Subtilisin-like protease 2 [Trichophyton violaceum]|uniref:Subtilisin-like protease 2 n=1 Tax=Trichophyton violaceum TaxID=34388 RepID=A0A178FC41_TRIVO|nr:Subtilisin-like protease 2 [Trichophyton violaceum]
MPVMQLLNFGLLLLPFVAGELFLRYYRKGYLAPQPEPLLAGPSDIVPGQYIVTLKEGLTSAQIRDHKEWVSSVHRANLDSFAAGARGVETEGIMKHFHIHDLNMYSGGFDEKTMEDLSRNPYVKSVHPDQHFYLAKTVTQRQARWGLGYMSSKGKPVPLHSTLVDYSYDDKAGEGVWAYVLDTGINVNHFGHGTYVAGIIAGKTYGVAKKANVVSAKAFDTGSSTYNYILETYDWIIRNITDSNPKNKAVINLSICMYLFPSSATPFDDAVEKAFKAGITTVVAAGNDGKDAKNNTPASSPNAITVGGISWENTRPSFSNYGKIVDIWAPGELIKSCWKGGNNATSTQSGTSAASPHVAGLVAYLMSIENLPSPSAVTARVLNLTIPNLVKDAKDSPNRVVYNGIQERKRKLPKYY